MSRDTKLYIGNLSSSITRGELEYKFEYYGRLLNVWVAKNPPGFAYIDFDDPRDAKDAIRGMDGKDFAGRRLRVELARSEPKSRKSEYDRDRYDDRGGGGGRGRRFFHPNDRCYNCGETGHYAYDCEIYSRRGGGRSSRDRGGSRRSRSPRRRRSYSRSYSRSRSRSRGRRRRSYSRSRSRSYSRSRSRSSVSRSRSRSRKRDSRSPSPDKRRSRSKSRSRSPSASPKRKSVSRSPRRSSRSPSKSDGE